MPENRARLPHADPADRLASLWDSGCTPDLEEFVTEHPGLAPGELAAMARVDQARRWQLGDRRSAEQYFSRFPSIRDDPAAALDMIHHEFILRESLGPPPGVDEFTGRFPEHATTIRDQVAIHLALMTDDHRTGAHAADNALNTSREIPINLAVSTFPAGFGRYILLERLGHGAMGTVYRAWDERLDRQVALKVLRMGHDPDGHFASRFLREIRIAANFTDPGLCPVYDAGMVNGSHFFTMPLIAGETLAARIKRDGAVESDVAGRLVARIARAVSIAHRVGVIHRDIKPANIMITSDGSPVVLDFGLARRAAAMDPVSTESGMVLGTPAYMAPEQICGDSRSVGPTADIYSLGVILYQLLTGRLPFEGQSHELMRQALTQDPVSPAQVRAKLDAKIAAICLTAMARETALRFPSMDAFADALELYLEHNPVVAHRRRLGLFPGRRTAVSGLIAILALTAIGLSLAAGRFRSISTQSTSASHFPKGAVWTGRFVFRGKLSGYEGGVVLTVIESRGDQFRATYSTEEGKFEWEVAGTDHDDIIHWEFVRATKGSVQPSIVGQAQVSGRYRNGVLDLVFTDGDSSADISLTRSP